jgi:hypothetical protein
VPRIPPVSPALHGGDALAAYEPRVVRAEPGTPRTTTIDADAATLHA